MVMNNKSKISAIEETQFKKFSCVKCSVQLKDVKLLKLHYWKVHIPRLDIFKPTDKIHLTTTVKNRKRKLTDNSSPAKSQAKRRNEIDQDDESLNDADSSLNDIQAAHVDVNSLSSDQIKTFNLSDVDEDRLFEKFKTLNSVRNRNFKEGQIVWAYYKRKFWPACIAKLTKNKSGSISRVNVRYFEEGNKRSLVFKLDPSKVTAFFNPVETHIKYKQTGADDKARRFEFLSCYSNALTEFCLSQSTEAAAKQPETTKLTDTQADTYFVLDNMLSKEEISQVAKKEFSTDHWDTIKEREDYSQRLMDVLMSNECQEFIVAILTKAIPCKRQEAYLNGTVKDRKDMKFCSPGPLLSDHQKELAENLEHLQATYFPTKPAHLTSYVYDVIYPEAVIWAIKRLDKCTIPKATSIYKTGFRQTSEEARKQRCNELLAEWRNEEIGLSESVESAGNENMENESSLNLDKTVDMSKISSDVADAVDSIVGQIEKNNLEDSDLPELEL